MDLLAPGPDPDAPRILWHVNREYSRDSFAPTLKATGNTFELRLNRSSMDVASYERRAIYRYAVGEDGHVHRVEPIAVNARGFVEEWLDAPWSESRDFADERGVAELGKLHQDFNPPAKLNDTGFVKHTYGPVRGCSSRGTFQVEIDAMQEETVPGKPGGKFSSLPSRYFRLREDGNGYVMVSVST